MQKIVDQEESDFYVAFTRMLCRLTFCLLSEKIHVHNLAPNGFGESLNSN